MAKIPKLEMAPWARKELSRQRWAAWRAEFFAQVRLIFILLFGAAIYVYIFNNHLQLELAASAGLHRIINHEKLSGDLRRNAVNYEKQIDQISK